MTSAGTSAFCYDQNGNMVRRTIGANVYNLTYDAENRLTAVSGNGVNASFVYDGDGRRVKGTVNGVTTTTIGDTFEWSGSTATMKKYYAAGGTRLAVRTGDTLSWLLGDHLGSTNITANDSAIQVGKLLYKPWGEERFSSGTTPTTFKFTGQRQESSFGLYLFGSRWYDPALARWAQPDSIVPEAAQGVQAWDRYAYVNNSPVNYTDPSGHVQVCADGDEGGGCGGSSPKALLMLGTVDPQKAIRHYLESHPQYQPELDPVVRDDRLVYSAIAAAKYQVEAQKPLDLGNWTLQIGIGGSSFAGIGVRGDISIAVDGKGNLGVLGSLGGGGYSSLGFSRVGPFVTATNAPSLPNLLGPSVQFGGQIGEVASYGAEAVVFKGVDGIVRGGLSVAGGVALIGPWPGEIHATVTNTWLLSPLNDWR